MAVVGIVCEYNPFHLGHLRQLRLIREQFGPDTTVAALMSGNFVQRGEPALLDKFTRARAAALCGADLVLELPLTCALSSAEGFAQGGVEVLTRLRAVDVLCFGSELGETEPLRRMARLLLSPDFDGNLRECLSGGVSFAAARAAAAERLGGDASLLRRPNDILAVEYCKAIESMKSHLKPVTVPRPGGYHDAAPDPEHPSATAVRALMEADGPWEGCVPPEAAAVFRYAPRYALRYGERAMLARLRAMTDAEFAALPYGAEGLWNRFARACRGEAAVEDILRAVKSKRYAYSRLMRMTMCAYLGLTAEDLRRPPPYVRVLALGDRGRALLRRARREGSIPVINAGETPPDKDYYALERRASSLHTLFAADGAGTACGLEEKGRIFVAGRRTGGPENA